MRDEDDIAFVGLSVNLNQLALAKEGLMWHPLGQLKQLVCGQHVARVRRGGGRRPRPVVPRNATARSGRRAGVSDGLSAKRFVALAALVVPPPRATTTRIFGNYCGDLYGCGWALFGLGLGYLRDLMERRRVGGGGFGWSIAVGVGWTNGVD